MLEETVESETNDQEKVESFDEIFEASLRSVQQGDVVKGAIVAIDDDTVTVDIGFKSEGVIPRRELVLARGEPFRGGAELFIAC